MTVMTQCLSLLKGTLVIKYDFMNLKERGFLQPSPGYFHSKHLFSKMGWTQWFIVEHKQSCLNHNRVESTVKKIAALLARMSVHSLKNSRKGYRKETGRQKDRLRWGELTTQGSVRLETNKQTKKKPSTDSFKRTDKIVFKQQYLCKRIDSVTSLTLWLSTSEYSDNNIFSLLQLPDTDEL